MDEDLLAVPDDGDRLFGGDDAHALSMRRTEESLSAGERPCGSLTGPDRLPKVAWLDCGGGSSQNGDRNLLGARGPHEAGACDEEGGT